MPIRSGHNWGKLAVDGSSLVFRIGGRAGFAVPLPDVSQAQQGREEVMLEFPLDDTVAGEAACRSRCARLRALRSSWFRLFGCFAGRPDTVPLLGDNMLAVGAHTACAGCVRACRVFLSRAWASMSLVCHPLAPDSRSLPRRSRGHPG